MITMGLQEAAHILQAKTPHTDQHFTGIEIDSRKVKRSQLFFAIPGERVDPHDHLEEAYRQGATAAVVQRLMPCSIPQLVVENSYRALGKLTENWRDRFDLPLIAVTGSNGKTTLKNIIAQILMAAHGEEHVLYSLGNLNSGYGLPLTLARLNSKHRIGVLEMGMSTPGEIEYISRLAKPMVAVINNVFPCHVQGLGSVDAIAHAKAEIFSGLNAKGTAVLNRDDHYYDLWCQRAKAHRIVSFSLQSKTDVYASNMVDGVRPVFTLHTPLGEARLQLPLLGLHNVRNALAAAACAYAAGISLPVIVKGLEAVSAVPGRLHPHALKTGAVLIDDAYNANPGSVRAAIDLLAEEPGRRVLVLGDMRELGENEIQYHKDIGRYAKEKGIEHLLATGVLMTHAVQAFGGGQHCVSREELLSAVQPFSQAGYTLLVKASQSMGLQQLVRALLEADKLATTS